MNKPLIAGIVIGCIAVVGGLITAGVIPVDFSRTSVSTTPSPAPEPQPSNTELSSEEFLSLTGEITNSDNSALELYFFKSEVAYELLRLVDLDGFATLEEAANSYISETSRNRELWDDIQPPAQFRDFHECWSENRMQLEQYMRMVARGASNHDLDELRAATDMFEQVHEQTQECLALFDSAVEKAY